MVNLGAAGHINSDSGFGPWPEGLSLLERLRRAAEFNKAQGKQAAARLSFVRRPERLASLNQRAQSRTKFNDDPHDLKRAAALLEDAGWRVSPPNWQAHVTGM